MKGKFKKTISMFSLILFVWQFSNFPVLTHAQNLTNTEEEAAETKLSNLNLHQWGAISLFHGLPSDRVRAVAQDREGVIWFGTDIEFGKIRRAACADDCRR